MVAIQKLPTQYSEEPDGNEAMTGAEMFNGLLKTDMNAKSSSGNSATVAQSTEIEAEEGSTVSNAWYVNGNSAWTGTLNSQVLNGKLTSMQSAEASNGVLGAAQYSKIEGDDGETHCVAFSLNFDYMAYVGNLAEGNAHLVFEGRSNGKCKFE